MNSKPISRRVRPVQLPIALLLLATLFAGFATVGHAEESKSLTTTSARPDSQSLHSNIRKQMKESARIAVWKTRISVGTDLGAKLKLGRPLRIAAAKSGKRG